jgi:hypothetical protein
MLNYLSQDQWQHFDEEGYVHLGRTLEPEELRAIQQRIDDIMMGRAELDYGRTMMQLEGGDGEYSNLQSQSKGHKGATLDYRKVQDLELDPLFLDYMQSPLFRHICARVYGPDTPVSCMRAMFMNKPAGKGSHLPWHQDHWTYLDHTPLVTVWTALDQATFRNGCVEVVPKSHLAIVNPEISGGFITEEQARAATAESAPLFLELQSGEAVLLHNHLLHRSATNATRAPRRAFSVCYTRGATRTRDGGTFPTIFGPGALSPQHVRSRSCA